MNMYERAGDAWSVLRGLKRVTVPRTSGGSSDRIGSPPGSDGSLMNSLSKSYQFFQQSTHLEPDRLNIYNDMDEMYQYVLLMAAMDAYVEDASQPDPRREKCVWVESQNPRVKAEIERLFLNLEVDERCAADMYQLGKYGDHFGLLMYEQGKGIYDIREIEPRICWRHEDQQRVLKGFTIDEQSPIDASKSPQFKPWDMVHFRMRNRQPTNAYGSPMFLNVRLTYKTLKLMEEQMTIYRMNMHPDRLIFKIATGGASPDERIRIINKWRKSMERNVSFDKSRGKFQSENSPWALDQNFYWPIGSGDDNSGIEKFPGSSNAGDLFDIRYVRDLLFAGTRVPKAYMGFEDSRGYEHSDTLSQQDIKFSRGCKRLQKSYLNGLTRVAKIHMVLRGINPSQEGNDFTLKMATVNNLDELQKAELMVKRMESVQYLLTVGEQMITSIGVNPKTWASYVLQEYGGIEQHTIAKLLAVEPEGGADITFSPEGNFKQFESLTEDQLKRLHDKCMGDEELHGLLSSAFPVDSLSTGETSNSSFDFDPLPSNDYKSETTSSTLAESFKMNARQPAMRSDEQKKRRLELRELVNRTQEEYLTEQDDE